MVAPTVGMIFAAGFATRLRPLSELRPKPLMELGGQPIIYHLIRMLEKAGIKDVYINLHYGAIEIQRSLLQLKTSCRLHFSCEEEILGTGGGLARVITKFGLDANKMVLLHGDILCDIDLAPLLKTSEYCTLLCARGHQVLGYEGGVSCDALGHILELGTFFSKPGILKEKGFFTGVHILSEAATRDLKNAQAFSLVGDIYPAWLKEGKKLKAAMVDLCYEDLGTSERLFDANMAILDEHTRFLHLDLTPKIKAKSGVYIEDGAQVSKGAKLKAPLWILKGAIIEDGAVVGPRVLVGEGAYIKSGARIANSLVMSLSTVEKDEHVNCAVVLLGARVVVKSKGDNHA